MNVKNCAMTPIDKVDIGELPLNYFPNVVIADVYVFGPFFGHWV